jgi:hypothetical protein
MSTSLAKSRLSTQQARASKSTGTEALTKLSVTTLHTAFLQLSNITRVLLESAPFKHSFVERDVYWELFSDVTESENSALNIFLSTLKHHEKIMQEQRRRSLGEAQERLFDLLESAIAVQKRTVERLGETQEVQQGEKDDSPLGRARKRGADYRAAVLGGSDMLTGEEFGKKLGGGLTRQAVAAKRKAKEIFALSWGSRKMLYPAWQLETAIFGYPLKRVLAALLEKEDDPWVVYRFFTTPEAVLGDVTPLEALRSGRVDEVVSAAEAFANRD